MSDCQFILIERIENTIEIFVQEEAENKLDYLKAYGECSYVLEILDRIELDMQDRLLILYKNYLKGLKLRSYEWIKNNITLK